MQIVLHCISHIAYIEASLIDFRKIPIYRIHSIHAFRVYFFPFFLSFSLLFSVLLLCYSISSIRDECMSLACFAVCLFIKSLEILLFFFSSLLFFSMVRTEVLRNQIEHCKSDSILSDSIFVENGIRATQHGIELNWKMLRLYIMQIPFSRYKKI